MKLLKSIVFPFIICTMLLLNYGCEKGNTETPNYPGLEEQAKIDDSIILEYISDNNLEFTKHTSGLYYKITEAGDQNNIPSSTSTVSAIYKGYFLNGSVFDDSDGSAISFPLQRVIKGWTYGIPLIGKGGEIILIIPSHLAYGNPGYGPIPPNTVLIFEVKLTAISG